MDSLTKQDGIEIQREQLKQWKRVLNDSTFKELQRICEAKNAQLAHDADGLTVFRGGDLDCVVSNISFGWTFDKAGDIEYRKRRGYQ